MRTARRRWAGRHAADGTLRPGNRPASLGMATAAGRVPRPGARCVVRPRTAGSLGLTLLDAALLSALE